MIRSYTPKAYRVNDALPLNIYQLLFNEEKQFLKADAGVLNIPTLVLIDPKDELISYKKLHRLISRFRLQNWQLMVLKHKGKDRFSKYHHQIIDEQTMGKENWEMATGKMAEFLFN